MQYLKNAIYMDVNVSGIGFTRNKWSQFVNSIDLYMGKDIVFFYYATPLAQQDDSMTGWEFCMTVLV